MPSRLLVMGDNHGDVESLRRVLADAEGESFDYAVHVGDFTNAWRTARRTDDEAAAERRGAEQLRAVEPVLSEFDALAEHGLVWVYGNQDYFGDLPEDLSVGTELPDDEVVQVGDLRFTNSLDLVAPDVVLVTHMEHWQLVDHFEGLAHFCGNSHRGRHVDSRLNSAFLQVRDPETDEKQYGGYFVVELADSGLDVEMRPIGDLSRVDCDRHRERGVQFQPDDRGCMFCNEAGTLMREMCASAFYGLTRGTDRDSVADEELVDYAEGLWDEPPEGFRESFGAYLGELESHRYAPLARAEDGSIRLAEKSYSY